MTSMLSADPDALSPLFTSTKRIGNDAQCRRSANRCLARYLRGWYKDVYLRNDLSCGIESCAECHSGRAAVLSASATHYVIPSMGILTAFVELLEVATEGHWKDIIFMQVRMI